MAQTIDTFIQLVRLGIGHSASPIPEDTDWHDIETLATMQGVTAVVLDGVERLPESERPPKTVLLKWIGVALQSYELRFKQYKQAIAGLASWYNSHGFRMMVLKGYACSLNWPIPEHRPCGDIDIWLFGQQKASDAALTKDLGTKIDNSHHHHTIFKWMDFDVENHYDFIEVHHHSSGPSLEKILKEKGCDDSYYVELEGERVYIPSPDLHALFLIRHMAEHFVSTDITVRHLLDWAFFVKKYGVKIDWEWLQKVLNQFGMMPLFNILNAICIEDLGFGADIFPQTQFNSSLKERVLNEIVDSEFKEVEPKGLWARIIFKYKRWKANDWKYKLCYTGSRWSAFWSAMWNHILKPSSI